jgi:hypothetical protein
MALSSECTGSYAQKVLDNADIVREAMLRQSSQWAARVLRVTIGLMRWVLITFEGFVTGVLAVVVSIVAFFVGLSAYTR